MRRVAVARGIGRSRGRVAGRAAHGSDPGAEGFEKAESLAARREELAEAGPAEEEDKVLDAVATEESSKVSGTS